ncbi:hypothetical protein J2W76_000969 [Methylorubrum zatmanii]|nr:hypothetical protein [Methylorubrum zatmanii]MCP1555660.1 hypothetical protein [Methylorubrum extorquens]MCP1578027.1 hypothetical protein [Methylorubrum extorquens]
MRMMQAFSYGMIGALAVGLVTTAIGSASVLLNL